MEKVKKQRQAQQRARPDVREELQNPEVVDATAAEADKQETDRHVLQLRQGRLGLLASHIVKFTRRIPGRAPFKVAFPVMLTWTEAMQGLSVLTLEVCQTRRNMQTMLEILKERDGQGVRTRMLDLCMNHQSFAQFVENVFALTCLAKEGFVRCAVGPGQRRGHELGKLRAATAEDMPWVPALARHRVTVCESLWNAGWRGRRAGRGLRCALWTGVQQGSGREMGRSRRSSSPSTTAWPTGSTSERTAR